MSYLAGLLTGVFLTILAVFVIDHVGTTNETSASEPQKILGRGGAEAALLSWHS